MAMEINSGTAVGRIVAAMRQQHWLSLALLALHGALMLDLADPLARALLLSHFGFFLLWQPLWRGEQKLIPSQVLLIIGAAVLLIAAGSWWLMALWISVLFSLIGGNVPGIKNLGRRMVSLLAAVYLLSVLLAWVVPHLFPDQDFPTGLLAVVRYGLMIPAAAIFFVCLVVGAGISYCGVGNKPDQAKCSPGIFSRFLYCAEHAFTREETPTGQVELFRSSNLLWLFPIAFFFSS